MRAQDTSRVSRFLQTDPIPGGSANAYDYCNQDPTNCYDLAGTWPHWAKDIGWAVGHAASKAVSKLTGNLYPEGKQVWPFISASFKMRNLGWLSGGIGSGVGEAITDAFNSKLSISQRIWRIGVNGQVKVPAGGHVKVPTPRG